jgi:hypothetical protein
MSILSIIWDPKGGKHVLITGRGREIRLTHAKLQDISLGSLTKKVKANAKIRK